MAMYSRHDGKIQQIITGSTDMYDHNFIIFLNQLMSSALLMVRRKRSKLWPSRPPDAECSGGGAADDCVVDDDDDIDGGGGAGCADNRSTSAICESFRVFRRGFTRIVKLLAKSSASNGFTLILVKM